MAHNDFCSSINRINPIPPAQLGLRPCRKASTGPQREAVRLRATFNPLQSYERNAFKN